MQGGSFQPPGEAAGNVDLAVKSYIESLQRKSRTEVQGSAVDTYIASLRSNNRSCSAGLGQERLSAASGTFQRTQGNSRRLLGTVSASSMVDAGCQDRWNHGMDHLVSPACPLVLALTAHGSSE